jgi:hypothetical protein
MINVPLSITCCDNNEVKTTKVITFSSEYTSSLLITNIVVNSNGNTTISAGDTVLLSVTVRNVDALGFDGCLLKFSIFDDFITLIDSTEYFGYMAGGNEYTLNNCIKFVVDNTTPNNYVAEFNTLITNINNVNSNGVQSFVIQGREIEVLNYSLLSGINTIFDPNETASLSFNAQNTGASDVQNLRFELRFMEPELTVNTSYVEIASMTTNQIVALPFQVSVSNAFTPGTTVDALVDIYVNNNLFKTEVVTIIGETNCDGFEAGFPTGTTFSDTAWTISTTVFADGTQSAASGNIGDMQQSIMYMQKTLLTDGTVSFKRKVSSEANYDYLRFSIDGVQKAQWSGSVDWAEVSYPVTSGTHTFTWRYFKDVNTVSGLDKAFVDDICFPSENSNTPTITVNPEAIYVEIPFGHTLDTTFTISSTTPIFALFTNQILDSLDLPVNWCLTNYPNGSVNALQTKTVTLKFNTRNKQIGQISSATLVTIAQEGNTIETPVTMKVVSGVGIDDYTNQNGYIIYPNPTQNIVQIASQNNHTLIKEVQLYNMNGKYISSKSVNDYMAKIDLTQFSSGLYFVKVISESNSVQHIKVVKK